MRRRTLVREFLEARLREPRRRVTAGLERLGDLAPRDVLGVLRVVARAMLEDSAEQLEVL